MIKNIVPLIYCVLLTSYGYSQYKLSYSDTLMHIGKLLYKEKDFINSKAKLDSCIFLNPKNDECMYYRAKIEFDMNNFEVSKIMFKNVLSVAERDPSSWHMLGLSFMNLRQYDSAEFCFRNAVNINSKESKYYANWAQNQFLRGNLKHAEQLYSTAILLDDKQSMYFQNRAKVRENLGDKTSAIEDLKQAQVLDPTNPKIQSEQDALSSNYQNWIGYFIVLFIGLTALIYWMSRKRNQNRNN